MGVLTEVSRLLEACELRTPTKAELVRALTAVTLAEEELEERLHQSRTLQERTELLPQRTPKPESVPLHVYR